MFLAFVVATGEPVVMFQLSLVVPVFPWILCFLIALRSLLVSGKDTVL